MTADYKALPRVVLRTPVLPFDLLARWADAPDRRSMLRALVADPAVREALYVASPELDAQIDAWVKAPAEQVAVERALVRYLTRMSARSTPFGLFSSVAVAEVGERSALDLAPRCAAIRHTRLDNDLLFALCTDLVKDREVRRHLRFRTTTSLYGVAGKLRYAEARLANLVRTYFLVAVDPTTYLNAILERARAGATFAELVAVLTADPEISDEEASAFLDDVIDAQLLVAELAPNVTGREPTCVIADALEAAPALAPLAQPLRAAVASLAAIDASAPGVPASAYRAIEATLRALPTKVEPSRLFQVDLFKPQTATIGQPVLDELRKAIDLLHRLAPPSGDSWARFREKFQARYETRSVPLVEVLDEETGIGFDTDGGTANAPLLADLAFPARAGDNRVPLNTREVYLMTLVAHALRTGAHEIELTDADLEALSQKSPAPLADTLCASAVMVATSEDAVEAGDFQLRINHVGRGANLLGRFCHGSPEVEALTAEALRAEEAQHPDAVFAEIVHLPEGRHGNVLLRPVLREYEIPYLGASGAPSDKQIDVTDLVVSIVDDRVVLRSRKLGREVIPRMTTAHNYNGRSLAIYRFLCSHAAQRVGNAYWSWGAINDFPFLPRVRRGKLILERARWLLTQKDCASLKTAAAFAALRERLGLPRWIVIGDGDNELPVDLDNDLMVDSAVHLLKNRASATLFELLPAPDELALTSPEGRFAHELIALFSRQESRVPGARPAETPRPALVRDEALPSLVERRFLPGSSWLYLKLYTGTATADAVLRDYLAPAIASLPPGAIDRWFFLRYADPEPHLRIRFAGDPKVLAAHVLPYLHAVLAPAVARGLVWKICVDTYEREVERYGGPDAVELAEQLFCADSDAALAIISACAGDAGADAMWRLAIRGCDQLMDDLGLSLEDKRKLMTAARDAFGAEHGADAAFYKQLGDKFRTHGKELAALLAASPTDEDHPLSPALAAFHARSLRLRALATRLRRATSTQSIESLVHSYVHMHVNRMIRSAQRQHELVIYDLLRRLYEGQVARGKQQVKRTA